MDASRTVDDALGRGSYGSTEALRLINFQRPEMSRAVVGERHRVTRITVARWLYGYKHGAAFSKPLWKRKMQAVEFECECLPINYSKCKACKT